MTSRGWTVATSLLATIISINISRLIIMIIIMVRIEVYDWDADGGHDFIGDCSTTLEELAQGEGFQIIQVGIVQ